MSELVRIQILLEKQQRDELNAIAKKEKKAFSELVRSYLDAQLLQLKYSKMRQAAELLQQDYAEGRDLTQMTSLDSEDFIHE
jgi:hypothetical protein